MRAPKLAPVFCVLALAAGHSGAHAQTPSTAPPAVYPYQPQWPFAPPSITPPAPPPSAAAANEARNPYIIYATPQPIEPPKPPVPPAPPALQNLPDLSLSGLGRSLSAYFTPEEMDLLFEYMKQSVIAALKGEEVSLPPDLAFKLEILLGRMQREGMHYMDHLIQQLERDLKKSLEKLTPPGKPETPPITPPKPEPPVTNPAGLFAPFGFK